MNRAPSIITALAVLLSLFGSPEASAQEEIKDIQLSVVSVDPHADSLGIDALKARMSYIRETEHRPTVALVLCGGGAKGAAHVGVLEYLEEINIPVDVVMGTSIGGLIGGMYALGYSAPYLDSLVRSINWDIAMSDKIPTQHVSYRDRRNRNKYIVNIPFNIKHMDVFGSDDVGPNQNALKSSIPDGLVNGLNVGNIFSSISVGYQDTIQFKDLPIPFCCVSSDIVSGKAKYWMEGDLITAMRSTMSIPGLFSPVRTDGMILIDGGTRNNFPADLAREIGADYIIGVDLANDSPTYDDINNLIDIVGPIIDMLGNEATMFNKKLPDLYIKPDVTGYGMLSFSPEAMDTLIRRGYYAAASMKDQLAEIKSKLGEDCQREVHSAPAIDINVTPVRIGSISFTGLNEHEAAYMRSRIAIDTDEPVTRSLIEDRVAWMVGTGAIRQVTYRLQGDREPYDLVFNCQRAAYNSARLGVRVDNEELVNVLLGVELGANKLQGFKFDLNAKIGQSGYVIGHLSHNLSGFPTINLTAKYGHAKGDLAKVNGVKDRLSFDYTEEQLYLSEVVHNAFDIRFGVSHNYHKMREWLTNDTEYLTDAQIKNAKSSYFSLFGNAQIYTLNNEYFPTRGISGGLHYQWVFADPLVPNYTTEHIISLGLRGAVPLGKSVALIGSLNGRGVLNMGDDISKANLIGGTMAGRYLPQQMPFCGFTRVLFADSFLLSAEADLQINLAKNHFLTGKVGTFVTDERFDGMFKSAPKYIGVAAEYGFNSIVGPIKADIMYSNLTKRASFYLSLGFDF